jgi:ParB/RepB/Spo0J family partition protein
MTSEGLASKKITKRSGLVSTPPAHAAPPIRDLSAAAAQLPSFEFARSDVDTGSSSQTTVAHLNPVMAAAQDGGVVRIPVSLLDDSPYQPRFGYDENKISELAESLANRQIDPLVVRTPVNGRYEIISGHRRKRAAPLAKLDFLECRVIEVSDAEARVLVLASNEPREDFTDYERAVAYKALIDDKSVRSQRQLAAKIGVDAALVSRRLSMLELPQVVQDVLREHPAAFSCRWVSKLLELTQPSFDADRLRTALLRVASGKMQMSALFSVMASTSTNDTKQVPKRGLSLHRGNQLFAQVTANQKKRQVVVSVPADDCDLQEVAALLLDAINERFKDLGPKDQAPKDQNP